MSGPILAFTNPKPKRQRAPQSSIAKKWALLARVRPNASIVVERLIDDLLAEVGYQPDGQKWT